MWNIMGIVFTFLFGFVFIYAFFAGLFRMNLAGRPKKGMMGKNAVAGITFTGIVRQCM